LALDDDIRLLSGVSLFESFTQDQLRLLAFGSENMRVPADRELYREGAEADCAFVVAEGSITLYRENENGERVVMGTAGDGAILGELALIADTSRLTGAIATVDTEVLRLSRRLFHRILQEYPDVAAALHRRIADDLAALVARIEALAPRFGD
jgi:CRP-like cAMP-binding protein